MDKYIKKSQTLTSISLLCTFTLCIIISIIGYIYALPIFYLLIIIVAVLGIFFHCIYIRHLKKSFLNLIEMTEMIIEQQDKKLPIIDGESYIAVLSSHLYLLDLRMKGMIERLSKEQKNLKNYIEDISHQIKTPLTAIVLKEDILLEISHGEERRLIEEIIFQTQKIHKCIESLLHLAQIESHTITYHKNEYLFDEIMNNIKANLKPILDEYHVSFQVSGEQNFIYCDFQWMSEALENILKNCIEQKKDAMVDITCDKHLQYQRIVIHDYGNGFYEKDIPHVFERFYQSEFQKKSQGIGIGLCISHGIIKEHHGTMTIYNDNGAVFEILLPIKETKSKYRVTNE